MESIMLDYLLSLVARQGTVWSESDHADMFMDGKSHLRYGCLYLSLGSYYTLICQINALKMAAKLLIFRGLQLESKFSSS